VLQLQRHNWSSSIENFLFFSFIFFSSRLYEYFKPWRGRSRGVAASCCRLCCSTMTSNAILIVGVLVFAFFLLCSATTIGALVGLFGFLVEVVQVRGLNRRAALRHEADDAHHVYIPGRRRGTAVGDIGVDEVAAVRQLVDRLTPRHQDVVTPRCVRAFSLSLLSLSVRAVSRSSPRTLAFALAYSYSGTASSFLPVDPPTTHFSVTPTARRKYQRAWLRREACAKEGCMG